MMKLMGDNKNRAHFLSYISTKISTIWMRFGATRKQNRAKTETPWYRFWHGVLLSDAPNLIQIGRNLVEI